MGRKSTIESLPEELRIRLLDLLKSPSVTQAEITAIINNEAGEDVISKSAVNRYASRMQKQIEKARQAREISEIYMEKMGGTTRNKLGKVVNEQIRLMSFELMGEIEELKEAGEAEPALIIDLIHKVSRSLKELEQAEKLNAERESRIRKEALEEAAEVAGKKLKEEGAGTSAILELKKELLGLA